ncbi:glycosyltransferase family 87 protein [Actinophytocola sp. NPDC049390]|uniref:glycosyltransferase family 87 protein n=1 Tax=Actinophytocola sp. NPDC049390 TaxID=3363894 RepID=UPI0037B96B3B
MIASPGRAELVAVRKVVLLVLVVVDVVVVAWFLLSFRDGVLGSAYRMDLDVYRVAVDVWWRGGDLYGELPRLRNGWHLPYLYPPVAVVVLAPFAVVPFWLASAVFALVTIAAVALVLVVVLRALEVRPTAVLVGALLPVALFMEPVRETLHFGQVNAVLMALVVADCLIRAPRWPRGVLVGVAAAVKLTPAVFVLFFLLRGDRRAAVTAGVSFLCATAVGFGVSWSGSVRFWTHEAFYSSQFRGMSNEMNQSLKVVLVRFGVDPKVLWPLLAVAVLGVTAVGMRRAFASGWPVWALGLNALGALLISPVSYSHHWVWVVPILLTGAVYAWRARHAAALAAVAVGALVFVLAPHWWWDPSTPWHGWRLLSGNAYVWAAAIVLVAAALPRRERTTVGAHDVAAPKSAV